MKQVLHLLTLVAIFLFAAVGKANAYDFSAENDDGVTIYYNIVDGHAEVESGDSKYSGDVSIPSSVTNDGTTYSVTSIVNQAFSGCSSLTSVTIPNSVTTIGYYAFRNCSSLTSVTIPSSVTSIGVAAFTGCSNLTSINVESSNANFCSQDGALFNKDMTTIVCCPGGKTGEYTLPSSVTSIGDDAFRGCNSLTSINVESSNQNFCSQDGVLFNKDMTTIVCCPGGKTGEYTIPEGVTSIGGGAFTYCSSLTSITIPEGVTSIGQAAFRSCSSLTSITIPEGVTSIGCDVFWDCCNLTSITIPEGVTSIEQFAFCGCSSLTSITIPGSVTNIGYNAFSNCHSLTSVTLSEGLTSIGTSAFWGCSGLESVTIPNSVTSIGDGAFIYCSGLTSVTIPNSVTSIGSDAFRGCSSLTSITIPGSVTSIGEKAFNDCSSLTSVTISEGVTSIGNDAFRGCSGLTSVSIPSSVTRIGGGMFRDCSSLTSVTIPEGVTSIGQAAFQGCSSLSSITIPSSVTSIECDAFWDCSSLTSVTIPDGVTSIEQYTFAGCSSLTSVSIPSSVTRIGYNAFTHCYNLPSITIPEGVTTIETSAFSTCISLTSVTIPSSVTGIGSGAFIYCSGLTSVTIPNSVTIIDDATFHGCSSLTSFTIPNSVTSIGNGAFSSCSSLTSITIPKSVTSIKSTAFDDCDSLTSVYSYITDLFEIEENVFSTYSTSTLYVPHGMKETYASTQYWSSFKNIEEMPVCTITAADTTGKAGKQTTLTISLENDNAVAGFQFDLKLPEGVSVAMEDGELAAATCGRAAKLSIVGNQLSDSTYRFVAISFAGKTISAGSGEVVTLTLDIADDVEAGDYTGTLSDIGLTEDGNSQTTLDSDKTFTITIEDYTLGDVNEDGRIDVTDAVLIMKKVVEKEVSTFNEKAADVNEDGKIDVTDAVQTVKIILSMSSGSRTLPEMRHAAPDAATALYLEDVSAKAGGQITLPIYLKNENTIAGIQFDLVLPDGVTIATDDEGELVGEMASRASKLSLMGNRLSDGTYRFVALSFTGKTVNGNDGELIDLTLNVDSDVDSGDYTVQLKDVCLTEDDNPQTVVADDQTATLTVTAPTPTAISTIEAQTESQTYNLRGQRVESPRRGIVITNGRKVLRK